MGYSTSFVTVSSGPAAPDPDTDRPPELADLRRIARRALRGFVTAARAGEQPGFGAILREHLEADTTDMEVVAESWPMYEHVNVQAGIDAWLAEPGREHRLVGMVNFRHEEFGLADLLRHGGHDRYGVSPGSVSRVNLPSGPEGQVRQCVQAGVYLVDEPGGPAALLLHAALEEMGRALSVEIVAADPERAAVIAQELRALALEHNVFRGQVLSFGADFFGERAAVLQFHTRPRLTEDDVILPEETLHAVSRQVAGIAEHRERLLAAGQHLKRGLLLHGPPGVGKTHTVRYLIGRLADTTIVELTGESLRMISGACSIARTLQPAMIIVEDVDLIAEDRGMHPGHHPLLFQLLNEMDGLAEDADVVFLLTTNRPDLLEPALAARPGRVDQAVELGLPDTSARRRLFELYRGDLDVDTSRLDAVLERTDGVTASFLKELLRRSAVLAAEESPQGRLQVSAEQLDAALDELLDTRNAMTRMLLGARQ
jgi:AAA+ superfamily predicted ATPase